MTLHGGRAVVTGRRSEAVLYDFNLATYDEGDTFDQSLAKGFVELWGLPSQDRRRARPTLTSAGAGRPHTGHRRNGDVSRPGQRSGAAGSPAARPRRWPPCRSTSTSTGGWPRYDIAGSRAHARVLHRGGAARRRRAGRDARGAGRLDGGVRSRRVPADRGRRGRAHRARARACSSGSAPLGGKLRAGRSPQRPGRHAISAVPARPRPRRWSPRLVELVDALVGAGRAAHRRRCPGMTHLQHAQPVCSPTSCWPTWALLRDVDRLRDWDRRAARLAARLGRAGRFVAAALDPEAVAAELGFAGGGGELDRRHRRPRLRRRVRCSSPR